MIRCDILNDFDFIEIVWCLTSLKFWVFKLEILGSLQQHYLGIRKYTYKEDNIVLFNYTYKENNIV